MFEILKLTLQGFSAYQIARKLNLDPPTVYTSLKAAKKNFPKAGKMLKELHDLGWPEKLPEIEKQIRNRSPQKRAAKVEGEVAFKMG